MRCGGESPRSAPRGKAGSAKHGHVSHGATTALGLWLLGIPLALVLGLIAGILEAIPYLGAWVAAYTERWAKVIREAGIKLE